MQTLTITNFGGPLTRRNVGDIDSGKAKFQTSWGYDPYSKPGNLTWLEQPTSILSWTVQAGPMMMMKQRTETTLNRVYGISRNGTLYNIRVSNTTSADVDAASIMGTLASLDDYNFGAGMTFYGSTEKIFIGSDTNIQRINFDGSSPSVVGSVISGVPRPMANFVGRVYFGNGSNIGEIDSTETITTQTKLSPALPSGLYVRDLDVTPDGNYLQIIASRTNASPPNGSDADYTSGSASDSYKFYWNGTSDSCTSFENFTGLVLSSNVVQGDKNYTFGNDISGAGIFSGAQKTVSLPDSLTPTTNAAFAVGNVLGFASAEYESSTGRFVAAVYHYGQYDEEVPSGLYRLLRQNATVKEDVWVVSACINASNVLPIPEFYGHSSSFGTNLAGTGKLYYSTQEGPTSVVSLAQKLWKFYTVPTGNGSVLSGVYETQTQLFSKKVQVKEVRLYTEPLVTDNSFTIDLIGSGGSVLSGGSQIFTVGTNVSAQEDVVRFNPAIAPTYALGVRITNSSVLGTKNWTALKMELDVADGGK